MLSEPMECHMNSWQQKPRVLIVDDDDEFMADLKILLSSEFDVSTAMGTRRASELLAQHRFDCLLLDLHMPGHFGVDPAFEGLAFLGHIRTGMDLNAAAHIPVIILTAHAGSDSMAAAQEYGIANLYTKPPDVKRLTAAIWNVVAQAKGN
jgi:two-component system sensor histidine kinase/response regulator